MSNLVALQIQCRKRRLSNFVSLSLWCRSRRFSNLFPLPLFCRYRGLLELIIFSLNRRYRRLPRLGIFPLNRHSRLLSKLDIFRLMVIIAYCPNWSFFLIVVKVDCVSCSYSDLDVVTVCFKIWAFPLECAGQRRRSWSLLYDHTGHLFLFILNIVNDPDFVRPLQSILCLAMSPSYYL